jgi:hypothetical protein
VKAAARVAALVATLAVAGCTGGAGSASTAPTGAPSDATPTASASAVSASFSAVVLDPILTDAAARTGLSRDALQVVTAESRTWPDGSLGCPQPGMAYPQVLTDGYRVVVRAGERELDYRGTGPGRFRLCEAVKGSGLVTPSG